MATTAARPAAAINQITAPSANSRLNYLQVSTQAVDNRQKFARPVLASGR